MEFHIAIASCFIAGVSLEMVGKEKKPKKLSGEGGIALSGTGKVFKPSSASSCISSG